MDGGGIYSGVEAATRSPAGSGFVRAHPSLIEIAYRAIDALVVGLGLFLLATFQKVSFTVEYALLSVAAASAFYVAGKLSGLYRAWRGARLSEEAKRVWLAWGITLLGLLLLAYGLKVSEEYSRRVLLLWFVVAPVALTAWRAGAHVLFRAVRRRGLNARFVAIAGAGHLGMRVAQQIQADPALGLRVHAFYDDHKPAGMWVGEGHHPIAGDLEQLVEDARARKVDTVYVTLPMRAEGRMVSVVERLADTPAHVQIVPDFFVFELLHARWSSLGGIPTVNVFASPFYGVDGLLKRIEDIFLATGILALIAVPMLVIAGAIKLTSPGPVIFKQRRYGLDGREVVVWKFRTMSVCEDGDAFCQAKRNDPRVTPLGAFLRKTSLDELPQFINVLQGRMSVVGPRPHPVALDEQHRKLIDGYMLRNRVKPGITGWAQVNGWRGETDTLDKMQGRVQRDLDYIRHWSLWLDIKIVFLTVFKGFRGQNAY